MLSEAKHLKFLPAREILRFAQDDISGMDHLSGMVVVG